MTDHDSARAKRHGFKNVGTTPNAAIEQYRYLVMRVRCDSVQRVKACRKGVERASAVVGDDEAAAALR